MTARSHRELLVWQKAMDLAVAVYELAKRLPAAERFGLTSQVTRAAISVPANIAEGSARGSARDYSRFLAIAKGSLNEVETYLLLAERLNYLTSDDVRPVLSAVDEIGRMLAGLQKRLRND